MKIRVKILLMLLSSIGAMAATIFWLSSTYSDLLINSTEGIKNASEFQVAFKDIQLDVSAYKESKDGKLLADSKKKLEGFLVMFDRREKEITKLNSPQLTSSMEDVKMRTSEISKSLAKLVNGYDELEAKKLYLAVNNAGPMISTLVESEHKNITQQVSGMRLKAIAAIVFIFVVILFATFRMIASIVTPLKNITTASQTVSKGDLTHAIKVVSKDEIGELAGAFAALTTNLANVITQLKGTSELISKTATEYSAVSKDLNTSAVSVSNAVQGIARGAYIQVKQVEKASGTIEGLVTNVTKVALRAKTQAEKTTLATDIAHRGGEATKEAVNKMNDIGASVVNSTNMVKKLKERSNQIGDITEAITKIAEQTNLLAINTAIEAARAGEGAREFRVIAEEVRKLAEASGKAANQIVKLLKEIQTETNQVIVVTENGAKEIINGVEFVNKSGKSIAELGDAIEEVNKLADEISKNTAEQSAGFEQVRKSITSISDISQENARSTDDVLKSSENQANMIKRIFEASAELKKLSDNLDTIVKQFKV